MLDEPVRIAEQEWLGWPLVGDMWVSTRAAVDGVGSLGNDLQEGCIHEPRVSEVPGPGQPLRTWDGTDPRAAAADAQVLIKASGSTVAIRKLIAGEQSLSDVELIALGQLNSRCHLQGYEPMTLLWTDGARLHPAIPPLLGKECGSKPPKG